MRTATGVRSSRVIGRLCRRDPGYRFVVGDDVPDYTVIARFRQRHVGGSVSFEGCLSWDALADRVSPPFT